MPVCPPFAKHELVSAAGGQTLFIVTTVCMVSVHLCVCLCVQRVRPAVGRQLLGQLPSGACCWHSMQIT